MESNAADKSSSIKTYNLPSSIAKEGHWQLLEGQFRYYDQGDMQYANWKILKRVCLFKWDINWKYHESKKKITQEDSEEKLW